TISLAAAGVLVMVFAKPDNAASPHFRLRLGDLFHDADEGEGVPPNFLILDAVQELLNTSPGNLGLVLRHFPLLEDVAGPIITDFGARAVFRGCRPLPP